jgi:hypothetical protein
MPSQPADVSPVAMWVQRVLTQLRWSIARYGMMANTLSLMEDQDKLRMRFAARDF